VTAPRPYRPPSGAVPALSCAAQAGSLLPPPPGGWPASGAEASLSQLPRQMGSLLLNAPPQPAPAAPAPPVPPALPAMRECCVCFADVAVADLLQLLPCCHRCVCEACAGRIVDAPPPARTCPKCRAHVERAARVYED
jgi:hypothetical protein